MRIFKWIRELLGFVPINNFPPPIIPFSPSDEDCGRKEVWQELGLRYHHDIGKINDNYYDFIIFNDGRQKLIKLNADIVDNSRNSSIIRYNHLKRAIRKHYKNDPLVSIQ